MIDVLIPGVKIAELSYFDNQTDQSTDLGQHPGHRPGGRLPPRVRVTITLEEGERREERVYSTETPILVTRPLTFGLPIY